MAATKRGRKGGILGYVRVCAKHALLIIGAGFMVMPFLWMLSTSLKNSTDVFTYNIRWLPSPISLEGYRRVWTEIPFARMYFNSFFVSSVVTASQLITCTLAAYAFARLRFPGRDALFMGYLATMMVPFQATMIPAFLLMRWLRLLDTYYALTLPFLAGAFGTFLLRQFFLSIPRSLEEAAIIDGCTRFQVLYRIIVPLSKPALSALGLFVFMFSWNDFTWPLIVTNRPLMRTIQVGLALLRSEIGTDWPILMAATALATVPILLCFVVAQNQFIRGITLTGLKY